MTITIEQRLKAESKLNKILEESKKELWKAERIVSSVSFNLTDTLKEIAKELGVENPETLEGWKLHHIIDSTQTITFRMSINNQVNQHVDKIHYIESIFRNLLELLVEK